MSNEPDFPTPAPTFCGPHTAEISSGAMRRQPGSSHAYARHHSTRRQRPHLRYRATPPGDDPLDCPHRSRHGPRGLGAARQPWPPRLRRVSGSSWPLGLADRTRHPGLPTDRRKPVPASMASNRRRLWIPLANDPRPARAAGTPRHPLGPVRRERLPYRPSRAPGRRSLGATSGPRTTPATLGRLDRRAAGGRPTDIAAALHCSGATVRRVRAGETADAARFRAADVAFDAAEVRAVAAQARWRDRWEFRSSSVLGHIPPGRASAG